MENVLIASGYPVLVAAIAYLYKRLEKCQDARLEEAHERERALTALLDLLRKKKNGGGR